MMKRTIAPVEVILRPKGLGLGAEAAKKPNATIINSKQGKNEEEEDDTLRKGSYVQVLSGPNRDLYGEVSNMQ